MFTDAEVMQQNYLENGAAVRMKGWIEKKGKGKKQVLVEEHVSTLPRSSILCKTKMYPQWASNTDDKMKRNLLLRYRLKRLRQQRWHACLNFF